MFYRTVYLFISRPPLLQDRREKRVSEQQAGIARQRGDLEALQQCVVLQYNTVLDAYSELQARYVDEPPPRSIFLVKCCSSVT